MRKTQTWLLRVITGLVAVLAATLQTVQSQEWSRAIRSEWATERGNYYDYNYRPPVGEHYVPGYNRRDGTYVGAHYQTNADGSFWNNWSSYGNVNPHTGKVGTKLPSTRSSGYYYRR